MPLEVFNPKCINDPANARHLPSPKRLLTVRIEEPLGSIQKLLPAVSGAQALED